MNEKREFFLYDSYFTFPKEEILVLTFRPRKLERAAKSFPSSPAKTDSFSRKCHFFHF